MARSRTERWSTGGGRGVGMAAWARGVRRGWGFLLLAAALATVGIPRPAAAQADAVVRGGSAVYSGVEVNIADNGRLARLWLAFEVQCTDGKGAEMAASPAVREAIVLFLRDKTAVQLSSPKGKRQLKEELLRVINKAMGTPRAVRVYLLQFVII